MREGTIGGSTHNQSDLDDHQNKKDVLGLFGLMLRSSFKRLNAGFLRVYLQDIKEWLI